MARYDWDIELSIGVGSLYEIFHQICCRDLISISQNERKGFDILHEGGRMGILRGPDFFGTRISHRLIIFYIV